MSDLSTPGFPSLEELGAWLPQYEIQDLVHAGRESVIYAGRQSALDRIVEIEVMPEPSADEVKPLLDRLRKRARPVHPSITAVFDFGRTPSGLFYLVTEHVEGTWLQSLIEQRLLKPKTAFPLALQICEALQLLHDHQMPHGCLSPATAMVTHEGQVKLTGIGMTAVDGELSWRTPFHGSFQGDIHDLGFTLHWMFAKEAPGADGRLSRDLPPAFASVLRRCLEAGLSRPFETPAQVSVALKEALRGEQEKTESTTRSKMVVAPGAKQAPPPVSAPTTPPPRVTAGHLQPVVRHHQPTFFQRLDAFVWKAFSTGLHLLISVISIGSVILLILFKDKIVFEEDTTLPMATVEEIKAVEKPIPAAVLGGLPPAEMLSAAPSLVKPLSLPASPSPTPVDPLADLRAQYVSAVQAAANHALETVKLDDLPHLQRELKLLQNGGDIPSVDEPNLPATLKALRLRYREARVGMVR